MTLNDRHHRVQVLNNELEARLMLRCSRCEAKVQHPSQLDASARCDECAS